MNYEFLLVHKEYGMLRSFGEIEKRPHSAIITQARDSKNLRKVKCLHRMSDEANAHS